jgi:hypothetical protein
MGRIIAHINKNSERLGCTISYSTASEYFDHVHRTKVAFPLYDSDFFPYADNGESYWTGYFTTRVRSYGFVSSLQLSVIILQFPPAVLCRVAYSHS